MIFSQPIIAKSRDIKPNASQKYIKLSIGIDQSGSRMRDLWAKPVGAIGNFLSFWDALHFTLGHIISLMKNIFTTRMKVAGVVRILPH